jgi:hypothetical protein
MSYQNTKYLANQSGNDSENFTIPRVKKNDFRNLQTREKSDCAQAEVD